MKTFWAIIVLILLYGGVNFFLEYRRHIMTMKEIRTQGQLELEATKLKWKVIMKEIEVGKYEN
jgi:cell division septal protein FtsQ